MKQIELFEKMIEKYATDGTDIDDQLKVISEDWNLRRLWDAYHHAKACESPYISFNDFFREKEIDPMCSFLDMAGITEFAMTSTSTALMENMLEFQNRGWKVVGLETIPIYHRRWIDHKNGTWETKPAVILRKESI